MFTAVHHISLNVDCHLLSNSRLINEIIKHITATSMVTCNEMPLFETAQL